MSTEHDPYWKLRPTPPTPEDEICSCEGTLPIVLARTFGPNPLSCLRCNLEVPPERVGFPETLAEELAVWTSFYAAFDTLWLDSGEFEDWARRELSDPESVVNRRGLALVAELNRYRPSYMYWFQEPGAEDYVLISDNYFCRLATIRFAGRSAVRTACGTVRGASAPALEGLLGAPDGDGQAGPLAEDQADGRTDLGGGCSGGRDEREDGAYVAARADAVGGEEAAGLEDAA